MCAQATLAVQKYRSDPERKAKDNRNKRVRALMKKAGGTMTREAALQIDAERQNKKRQKQTAKARMHEQPAAVQAVQPVQPVQAEHPAVQVVQSEQPAAVQVVQMQPE